MNAQHYHVRFTSTLSGTVSRTPRYETAEQALDYIARQPDMGPGRDLVLVPCTQPCPLPRQPS